MTFILFIALNNYKTVMTAENIIAQLDLKPHPEGGFYKRTYTDAQQRFSSILFLLLKNNFAAFHRISSEEQWNWYWGDDILIHEIDKDGNYQQTMLSGNTAALQLQYVVKVGHWFASECIGNNGFALCGCTVIPAFRFEDFELADRKKLADLFPQHQQLINALTRK
ncbi:MAG TPA: cupin domain-containing protein [Chitinophagales bacterium]|nr:cupin domain-containing protein [Chitinophagales bacterium]